MAETDPKIMALVEAALGKNPDASVEELYRMAKKSSRAVGRMNMRQFHARYPLQVKRRKNRSIRKAKPKKAGARATARKTTAKAVSRVKKAARRGRPPGSRNKPKAGSHGRDGVRAAFLSFAADLTAAEGRHAEFGVIANVDSYVDKAMRAAK